MDRLVRVAVAAVAALIVGCSTSPSILPSRSPSGTAGATPLIADPSTPQPSSEPAGVTIHALAADLTTPLQDQRTDGRRIVYSSGAAADAAEAAAPDLYLFDPRTGEDPKRIYANPNRDAALLPIAISGDQFAFAESDLDTYGPANWVLWYMASADSNPVVVDRTDATGERKSPLPLMSLDGDRLVWQAYHDAGTGLHSQLLMFDGATEKRTVLFSAPVEQSQYWYPDLDGNLLVFGRVDLATVDGEPDLHVYLVDLGAGGQLSPQRLDAAGGAVTPQIRGDTVVWKEPATSSHGGRSLHSANALALCEPLTSECLAA
jgi:hypothetical protein